MNSLGFKRQKNVALLCFYVHNTHCSILIMDDCLISTVTALYRENKWLDIVDLNPGRDNEEKMKLLWVWPSIKNLEFLKYQVNKCKVKGITSIGCGCGLLEWLINQYMKFEVVGLEVNAEWWKSKYSTPQFITLTYIENNNYSLNPKYALLFCYFNDGVAFNEYVKNYLGNLIFIIGPSEERGTHTDPTPFKPNFIDKQWILEDYQEVRDTKDFIAVYVRCR